MINIPSTRQVMCAVHGSMTNPRSDYIGENIDEAGIKLTFFCNLFFHCFFFGGYVRWRFSEFLLLWAITASLLFEAVSIAFIIVPQHQYPHSNIRSLLFFFLLSLELTYYWKKSPALVRVSFLFQSERKMLFGTVNCNDIVWHLWLLLFSYRENRTQSHSDTVVSYTSAYLL